MINVLNSKSLHYIYKQLQQQQFFILYSFKFTFSHTPTHTQNPSLGRTIYNYVYTACFIKTHVKNRNHTPFKHFGQAKPKKKEKIKETF